MGKSVKYPEPPDPVATANAQGAINRDTAITQAELNMVDQQGPFGSLTYTRLPGEQTRQFDQVAYDKALEQWNTAGGTWQDVYVPGEEGTDSYQRQFVPGPGGGPQPARSDFYYMEDVGTPRYQATTTLSPEQQGIFDRQMGLQTSLLDVGQDQLGRVGQSLGMPLSFDTAPQGRSQLGDFAADRSRVEAALMQRMQPYLDQRREQERTRLVNQGFADPASQGYSTAMDEVYRAENDARLAAIAGAGQEQARLQGMDAQRAAFENEARQRAIQEAMLLRQTPINEIGALMSGSQVQLPQFVNTPQTGIQAPDLQGATYASYQAQLNNAQQQAANNRAMTQGLFSLGGAGLGAFGAINPFGWGR